MSSDILARDLKSASEEADTERMNKIRLEFPTLNEKMQRKIDQDDTDLWHELAEECFHPTKDTGRTNKYTKEKRILHKKFEKMKSTPDDDFAELIGEDYENKHYKRLKNIAFYEESKTQNDIETVIRIYTKEWEYRTRNYRRILKYIIDVSTQKTTASTSTAIGDISDYYNKMQTMYWEMQKYDPTNAELFISNYKKIAAVAAAKERSQEHSSLSSEEGAPESLADSSIESKIIKYVEQIMKNQSKNPRMEGNFEKQEEIVTITGEGSKKGGEAGLVPRTYSMGAQPPSSNQPLTGTTKEKYEDKYLSSDSNLPEDYFKKRTKLDQEYKNQSKNPRKEVNTKIYEDEYFEYLSNSESEVEIEQSSEKYRNTEKMLGQIAHQKGSSEPMQIENAEIPQNILVESKIPIETPPPVSPPSKAIIKHADRDISDAQRELYPEVKVIQLDGPSDADNAFSPSSEEEELADLSMEKKNFQHKRNIKRRKTSRTKEELEMNKKIEKHIERAEIEKMKTVVQKNDTEYVVKEFIDESVSERETSKEVLSRPSTSGCIDSQSSV
ncbi:hypothetical protein JTB14_036286 [Gonioctena quinquepunctata]|nr:hypothetical protein JTB14_036286 [Gonioctena quinquepunctata]